MFTYQQHANNLDTGLYKAYTTPASDSPCRANKLDTGLYKAYTTPALDSPYAWPLLIIELLTLYQPMTVNALMVSHKPITIHIVLGVILPYMVSASLSQFLWSLKS